VKSLKSFVYKKSCIEPNTVSYHYISPSASSSSRTIQFLLQSRGLSFIGSAANTKYPLLFNQSITILKTSSSPWT
jgi:hypothetical protein